MLKQILISIVFIIQTSVSFACLNTYQFKVFPVGVSNKQIITVDVIVKRTSQEEGNYKLKFGLTDYKKFDDMWILYSSISTYDKNQKLLSNIPMDTVYALGESYTDTLNKTFLEGVTRIENEFTDLEYFTPEYISFCDFQQKCNRVQVKTDTVLNRDYIIFDGETYQIELKKERSEYNITQDKGSLGPFESLYVNSVRVYKTTHLTLCVNHIRIGQYALISTRKTNSNNSETTRRNRYIPKEHRPDVEFTTLKTSTYQEPVLHHDYGFDVFIVEQSQEPLDIKIDTVNVMILPCANGYEYAMHNYDFNPILETELNQFKNVRLHPFPLKKMMGIPYQGIFDKKYCRPILEKVNVDFLILTRFSQNYSGFNRNENNWGYELRILNAKTLEQVNSIKANNLMEYEEIEQHIKDNIDLLKMDIIKSHNKN